MNDELPEQEGLSTEGTFKAHHLILIAVVTIVVGAGLIYWIQQRGRGDMRPRTTEGVVEVPEGTRAVTLFFAADDSEALITETRLVAIGKELVDQIEQVVKALLDGPTQNGVSTIALGTGLLAVFYDSERATVYIDFTSEIVAGHPGGTAAEYFTIASIVRTISENFPEVEAVQVLVEGLQVGTIAGHIDAYKPFLVRDWR